MKLIAVIFFFSFLCCLFISVSYYKLFSRTIQTNDFQPQSHSSLQTTISLETSFSSERTLLIIQGSWRTFDTVVDSVIANLIMPNSPCDVVLSLDEPGWKGRTLTHEKLAPYLVAELYPLDSKRKEYVGIGVEFSQVMRALDNLNISIYSFIMKTRTDLFIHRPISFKTATGRSEEFPAAFRLFIRRLRILDPEILPCDVISRWIWSGGIDVYLDHAELALGENPPVMLWSPLPNIAINHNLQNSIKSVCNKGWGDDFLVGWKILADSQRISKLISGLIFNERVMWMQGSTWLSWGPKQAFLSVYSTTNDALGLGVHDWRSVPPPLEHLSRPNWTIYSIHELNKICEIVVRIAHPLNNAALIELRHRPEMTTSFSTSCAFHCFNTSESLFNLHLPFGASLLRPLPANCAELMQMPLPVALSVSVCFNGYSGVPGG